MKNKKMKPNKTKFSCCVLTPLILAGLTSCASTEKTARSFSSLFSKPAEESFKIRPYHELVLDNGLKILFIPDSSLPRVSLSLLVKTGTVNEGADQAGLNAMTANLLEQGTTTRDASKIADEFAEMGSGVEISPGQDMTSIYADSLTSSSESLLKLFSDIVLNPSFQDAEIKRLKSLVLSGLKKKVDSPSAFIEDKFDKFIFENHPYARDINGTEETVNKISKQDIIKHYLNYYRPNNSSLAVVGLFDEDFEKQIKEVFSGWNKRQIPSLSLLAAVPSEKMKVQLFVKKGLQQAQIRIGQLGVERANPDLLPLRLANEILGGDFTSRLNQKVREELGLTYSISSNFDVKKDKGSFEISTFTKNDTALKTFEETLNVVQNFIEKGVQESEINAGKNQMVGQFPHAIETPDRLAFNLLALDFYGIPHSYLTDFNKNVKSITPDRLNSVLRKYIEPNKFKVVIYGNESIVSQFEKYQPEVFRLN